MEYLEYSTETVSQFVDSLAKIQSTFRTDSSKANHVRVCVNGPVDTATYFLDAGNIRVDIATDSPGADKVRVDITTAHAFFKHGLRRKAPPPTTRSRVLRQHSMFRVSFMLEYCVVPEQGTRSCAIFTSVESKTPHDQERLTTMRAEPNTFCIRKAIVKLMFILVMKITMESTDAGYNIPQLP